MIQPARFPRALRAGGLRALHVSLNSPVVAHESLPSGPASAAVALDAQGALVCLRSVRSGRTAFWISGTELAATPRLALDAALSFAESLGFLFDDDEVLARGDEAARLIWADLCGDAAGELGQPDTDALELEDAGDDALWQGDLMPARAPERSLSKFRIQAGRTE